ncbi:type VI secretion system effector, Hcp1 family [Burkholderia sp. CF099]|nr:type VI secretion system effector, Hcp1 family [Burkholderia sp. CF099]
MTLWAYMSVTGKKQGPFKGEGANAQYRDRIPLVGFTMELEKPYDVATGQITGKLQFQPVTVVKEWGAASPQGLEACSSTEEISAVRIEFVRMNSAGKEYVFQTVSLTDALITEVSRFIGDPEAANDLQGGSRAAGLERWSFIFQKIEVDDTDGKTSFVAGTVP